MMTAPIREKVVAAKVDAVRRMISSIEALPLEPRELFFEDARNIAAGESYVRRCLEALLDLGRHILAKGFGVPVVEYREIGRRLGEHGVLDGDEASLLVMMGGYRNRLTHFYDEVTPLELHDLLTNHLNDIETVLQAMLSWLRAHPERIDTAL